MVAPGRAVRSGPAAGATHARPDRERHQDDADELQARGVVGLPCDDGRDAQQGAQAE
jgi:hypothetical protein